MMKKKDQKKQAVYAAISLALYEFSGELVHDDQPMRLTIRRTGISSAWGLKSNLMRLNVERKF